MALLIINHVVGDYETFSKSFWTRSGAALRLEGARVYRSPATPTTSASCSSSTPSTRRVSTPRGSSFARPSSGPRQRVHAQFEVLDHVMDTEPSRPLHRTSRGAGVPGPRRRSASPQLTLRPPVGFP